MKSCMKISFNYEVDGKVLHYSCRELKDLERTIQKDNLLAPKIKSRVINPKYKNLSFVHRPQTVEELIIALKRGDAKFIDETWRNYSTNDYIRKGIFSFEEVFDKLVPVEQKENFFRRFDGERVSMNNAKYHVFKKNRRCVCCGLEGKFLALEQCRCKDEESLYHFNMYGFVNGREILFTKDHILPKSKGGTNTLDNYQTMCVQCNAEKGDRDISLERLRREVLKKRLLEKEQLEANEKIREIC